MRTVLRTTKKVPIHSVRRRGFLRVGTALLCGSALLAVSCGSGESASSPSTTSTTSVPETTTTTTSTTTPTTDAGFADGGHEVRVDSVDPDAGTVAVQAVEVLEGAGAAEAYEADTGYELEGPRTYVRDVGGELVELPADPGGDYAVISGPECCEPQQLGWDAFAELAVRQFPDRWGVDPPFSMVVEDGTVTSLVQVYLP